MRLAERTIYDVFFFPREAFDSKEGGTLGIPRRFRVWGLGCRVYKGISGRIPDSVYGGLLGSFLMSTMNGSL